MSVYASSRVAFYFKKLVGKFSVVLDDSKEFLILFWSLYMVRRSPCLVERDEGNFPIIRDPLFHSTKQMFRDGTKWI